MADIVYTLEGDVYLNITNKCPCNCAFCIRSKSDAYGDSKELWFDKEPTFEEIGSIKFEKVDGYCIASTLSDAKLKEFFETTYQLKPGQYTISTGQFIM